MATTDLTPTKPLASVRVFPGGSGLESQAVPFPFLGDLVLCRLPADAIPASLNLFCNSPTAASSDLLHPCIVVKIDYARIDAEKAYLPVSVYPCVSSSSRGTLDELPPATRRRCVPFESDGDSDEMDGFGFGFGFGRPVTMTEGFRWARQTWVYAQAVGDVNMNEFCPFPPEGRLPRAELSRIRRYIDSALEVGCAGVECGGGEGEGEGEGETSRMVDGEVKPLRTSSYSDDAADDTEDNDDASWDGEDHLPLLYMEYLLAPVDKWAAEAVKQAEEAQRRARLEKVKSWQAGLP